MIWRFWRPREVTLVIDDGPTEVTPQLLSELDRGGHRAVLFVLGWNIPGREAVLIDAVRRGFPLGNHSFHHYHFSELTLAEARVEIETADVLLEGIYREAGVARPGRWFRFPFEDAGEGQRALELQRLLQELGFERPCALSRRLPKQDQIRVDWQATLHTADWQLPELPAFRDTVRRAAPGEIIELHDKLATVPRYVAPLLEELARQSLRATLPGASR